MSDAKNWVDQIFEAKQTDKAGILRRSVEDVNKHASHEALLLECKARGFHLISAGEQYVIICNNDCMCIYC